MKLSRAFLVMLVIVLFAIIHLLIQTYNITLKYETEELKRSLISLHRESRMLGSIVAALRSLDRIEKIAKGKLNMIYPEDVKYINIYEK